MAALPEELVEEIFLRIPPEEPAYLIRAAVVCKAWYRILSDAGLRRRYRRRFHPTSPTLLDYICNGTYYGEAGTPLFVPTTSFFSPPPLPSGGHYWVHNCRHGRVLIQDSGGDSPGFIVWDLITGGNRQQRLGFPTNYTKKKWSSFTVAVLCARHRYGCDHLDCHGGPFLVVFVETTEAPHDAAGAAEYHHVNYTSASVYSSEMGAWSAAQTGCYHARSGLNSSILIGDALYFTSAGDPIPILNYNLGDHGLSVIDVPQVLSHGDRHDVALPIEIDGGLGIVQFQFQRNCINTWSRQVDADGRAGSGWVTHSVLELELETLIATRRFSEYQEDTICFVEGTNSTVLLCLDNHGVFTLDIKSRQLRKVAERWDDDDIIIPCRSFDALIGLAGKLSPR